MIMSGLPREKVRTLTRTLTLTLTLTAAREGPNPNPNPNPNPDPNQEINPRVDELNALIDQLRDCAVVPLRMPREPSHFEPDGLHLSEHTGYPVLLAQLAAHVPLLAPSAR